MRVDTFDYDLPPERIAQEPAQDREAARLMLVGNEDGREHLTIADLPELVASGTLVVVNDTRVLHARLLGEKRATGGRTEILLVRKLGTRKVELECGTEPLDVWSALGRASKGLKAGACIDVGSLEVHILARHEDGMLEVALRTTDGSPTVEAIHRVGHVPLPPYIRRSTTAPDDALRAADAERYQTVFARVEGAVAAPTAGLHLTTRLLERLRAKGCPTATVTLHVGLGTFQPVSVDDLDQHPMHEEWYEVPEATANAVDEARARGASVLAIGTTVVRALESAADPSRDRCVRSTSGDTRLLIQPGYRFRVVDLLLTNFHLPRSTLLALVCAFAGTERVLAAYRAAVAERYRFFSYGDAMLLGPDSRRAGPLLSEARSSP